MHFIMFRCLKMFGEKFGLPVAFVIFQITVKKAAVYKVITYTDGKRIVKFSIDQLYNAMLTIIWNCQAFH